MRILLTGATGQVGWELRRTLAPLGQITAFGRDALDFRDRMALRNVVREFAPNLIVNACAYTAVDNAEADFETAEMVNGIAPGILAEEAKRIGAILVHYSTDYVFDGTKSSAYDETDSPNPMNAYGKTKLMGEQAIQTVGGDYLIFRTSWVYGSRGKNFLLSMLRLAKTQRELRIVNDQIGAPTWCRMIAEMTALILARNVVQQGSDRLLELGKQSGVYHLTAAGSTSWFGFAEAIFSRISPEMNIERPRLLPIPASAYPTPASRPSNSVMDNGLLQRTFGLAPVSWEYMLTTCMEEITACGSRP